MKDTGWITPRHCGSGYRGKNSSPLVITLVKAGKDENGKQKYRTSFRFNKAMMQKLRWLAGDKVKFKIKDNSILARRSNVGFTLSSAQAAKSTEEAKRLVGTMATSTVQVSSKFIDKRMDVNFDDIEFDGETLIIPLGDKS